MKNLIATTAIAMFMAAPLAAQTATTDTTEAAPAAGADTAAAPAARPAGDVFYGTVDNAVMASDFIGKRVYATDADVDTTMAVTGPGEGWEDIGEVSDVVIDLGGDVEAVLVDVGGFLGIGEKTVAVNLSSLGMVPDGDDADDYYIVMAGTRESLENAPAYNADGTADMDQAAATTEAAPETTAMAASEADATHTDMAAGEMNPAWKEMTAEELTGKRVIGANGEDVGEIGEVVVDDQMMISKIIVDVGGFLGMGEKPVALSPDQIDLQKTDSGDITFHVNMTEAELKEMPEYM